MYLVDTHCHLFEKIFEVDIHTIMEASMNNQINKIVLPNLDETTIQPMFNLSNKFPDKCFPMLGLHPAYVKADYLNILEQIFKYQNEKIYGIGEIGLDYYHDITFVKQQKNALEIQLSVAHKKKLPVSLHTRNATQDVIEIMQNSKVNKGIFHCFSEDYETAKKIIDMGFLLGIGGVLTFKNSALPEVIKKIPLDFIVFETDAPYLAPTPFRGKRNEPAYIKIIAEKYAEICNLPLEEIMLKTTQNANNIFSLWN